MADLHNESVLPALLEDEMRNSYLDYSMSVIVSRAIPDVRDGLKPVHRRILFGMDELGLGSNRPYKKSARIVGEVLGKYHPHGDGAVYDSMVRMAQEWSLRYPLVDGQGNFGSVDGDSAAAMRYTEARFASISQEVMRDIDKETVDFRPNFDESLQEPTVMPTVVPMLLVNGSGGIAVGMATNIPPHNLREVVNGLLAQIKNPDITTEELMQHITAPDFPTGGIIYGYDGVRDAYMTGRGRVRIRAKADVEEMKSGRERIIVTELPYQVNKAHLIEKIADLVRDKKLEDISDIRDESDRKGMRIVIEIKRDAMGSVVLNNLFKHTQMQTTFGVIMLALVNGRPKVMPLREVLGHFIDFRNEVIVRRTQYDLNAAQKRAHILEGYLIALDNIDAVIQTIRESADVQIASAALQSKFGLSPEQAKAILEMRLQRLTGLEREKIENEYRDLLQLIEQLQAILDSKELQMQEIAGELEALRDKYGDERRTAIEFNARGLTMEDMIAEEDMIVSITKQGFIKRTAAASYRAQSRGGRGLSGAGTRDKDFVEHLFQASTHHHLLFFTDHGRVFKLKVYELPEGMRNSKGRSINNVLEKQSDENVTAYLPVKEFDDETFVVMTTRSGVTKRVAMSNFANIRRTGIRAVNLNDDDKLISVALTDGNADIMIASRGGQLCRFHESELRPMGRTAAGVRGIRLDEKDHVVKMIAVTDPEETIVIASEKGYGKRNIVEDFRKTKRGAKGVRMMQITDKTGEIVSMLKADENMDLVMITVKGVLIRQHVSEIRVIGRNTQGVRLIKLDKKDSLADITRVEKDDEEDLPTDENGVVIEGAYEGEDGTNADTGNTDASGESVEESGDNDE